MIVKNGSRWVKRLLIATVLGLSVAGILVYIVDPFFHYHKPLDGLNYKLKTENQRYQNFCTELLKRKSHKVFSKGTRRVRLFLYVLYHSLCPWFFQKPNDSFSC